MQQQTAVDTKIMIDACFQENRDDKSSGLVKELKKCYMEISADQFIAK